jgi:hypothetical protein
VSHSTESTLSQEIITLVTSANIYDSDNVLILRSLMYIVKCIGHAADSQLSELNLKSSTFFILFHLANRY